MANIKISDLTAAAAALGTQQFEVNESGTSKRVTGSQILTYVKGNTTASDIGAVATTDIGSTVQAYDADTAKLDVDQSWSGSQRGAVTTDNDGSFDMNVGNNFSCTPSAGFALTFTNITAGQSGYVLLINTGGHAITAAATTKVGASTLSTISAAGTYLLSYFSNGTNVYVTASGALA